MRYTILLLLFFVFSFLFKSDHSFDQDLGRHIKLGEIIIKTRQVPRTNLFSYTNPDFPFINTHWLFEVWTYLGSQLFSVQGLLIGKLILILISVWLTLKIVPKQKQALLLSIGFIFLHVLRERTELRPEIFSFLFTALTLYILEKFSQMYHDRGTNVLRSRSIFLLPLIQLLWINTHIYFFIGLILQVIYIIHICYLNLRSHMESGKLKLIGIIFGLSVLVSLINPNGLTGLLYPLNVTKNYGYTIVENQTMFLLENIGFRDPNFLFVKLSFGIIVLSLLVLLLKRQFELKNILLSLSGLGLALINVRSFPYLVFLSLPATLMNFPALKFKGISFFLLLVTCCLLLFESFFYLNGDYYRFSEQPTLPKLEFLESAKLAIDFMISKDLPQPIFNNFDIGSYIIYRGFPKYQVFVDGRPEAYPAQFFTGFYIPSQSDYKNFKEAEKIYNFKTIIFSHTDQTPWAKIFLQSVVKDAEWKVVYIDDFIIILVTNEVSSQKQLPVIDLSKLNPSSYQFDNHLSYLRMGLFLLSAQNIESGRQFITKELQLFPDDPIGNQLKGQNPKNIFFW